jgi:hypothetical protein
MAGLPFQPIAGLYSFGASNMSPGTAVVHHPGSVRSSGSSDDNVDAAIGRLLRQTPEQQAETIRKQAAKLVQLQTLLDVAIQEQNLEESNEITRVQQLLEVLAIKDEANKELQRGVQELETALAEAKMNLEYMHGKWRDEAITREEAETTVKLLRSQIDAAQDEADRQGRLSEEASEQARIATEDAAICLEARQDAERELSALAREFNAHEVAAAETKRRFAELAARRGHLATMAGCFAEWRSRVEVHALREKFVRALDTNFRSRRLLAWKAARGLEANTLMDAFEARARAEVDAAKAGAEQRMEAAARAGAAAGAEARRAEDALRACQEELLAALHRNEELSLRLGAGAAGPAPAPDAAAREAALEAALRRAEREQRVLAEELRLAQVRRLRSRPPLPLPASLPPPPTPV